MYSSKNSALLAFFVTPSGFPSPGFKNSKTWSSRLIHLRALDTSSASQLK